MARPRSEDKRNALLAAATQVFANKGLSAPTSAITNAAGLAEGTLFVYFKGKDELINTLYEEIKVELAAAMMAGYKKDAPIRSRMQHVWNNFVAWGARNPERLALSHKIKVWEGLKPEVQETTMARFAELHSLISTAVSEKIFQDLPQSFVIAMLSAQAETTMQFMRQDPSNSKVYQEKGFEVFWNGLSIKS